MNIIYCLLLASCFISSKKKMDTKHLQTFLHSFSNRRNKIAIPLNPFVKSRLRHRPDKPQCFLRSNFSRNETCRRRKEQIFYPIVKITRLRAEICGFSMFKTNMRNVLKVFLYSFVCNHGVIYFIFMSICAARGLRKN